MLSSRQNAIRAPGILSMCLLLIAVLMVLTGCDGDGPTTVDVSGYVMEWTGDPNDPADGSMEKPLAGVEVSLGDPAGGLTATTESNGVYLIENVPVGTYDIAIAKQGYTVCPLCEGVPVTTGQHRLATIYMLADSAVPSFPPPAF